MIKNSSESPVPRRSPSGRFRFSLAQLLGLVLVVGIALGTIRLLATLESVPVIVGVLSCATLLVLVLVFRIASQAMKWVEVAVITGLVAVAASCMIPAFWYTGRSARGVGCSNHLRHIAIAMHSYHDDYGSLPPAYIADASAKPVHSWRVLLLPYLEHDDLYQKYRFDEPWDGPNNRKLHDSIVDVYWCPEQRARSSTATASDASYVVVVGPKTAFPGNRCVSLSDIRDGTSNTLLVVEIRDSGIHWMEPRDLHVSQMNPRINPARGQGISSAHEKVVLAARADGSVLYLTEQLSASEVAGLLTIDGGEPEPSPKR